MKKKYISLLVSLCFIFGINITLNSQDVKKPDWKRWHYLSEKEMYDTERGLNFVETDPPAGTPRFVGEFEPMQGVMIRYPLGIPTSLVVNLANNCHVYCIVASYYQNSAQNEFQNAGVNMNNLTFVNATTDSYWIRDYGPWYIFEDRQPAIVDNVYNRPRPNDDNVSGVFASFWNIPMYGMNLEHTGGNMMEDGRGHGVSDELVLQENGNNETNVRNKMREYLGIDPYHITIDPQGDYIAHVDCWGKYLAPDKILIARVPQSNAHYNDYEEVAEYFANTNCCWGYPYRVYRVDEPGGYTLAPYTNSLILNHSVYVPLGDNATYNADALAVYQEAMPGYEVVGVTNTDWSIGWENTDALHCRTRGVMDFDMLFVDHRDVLHGEQEWQDAMPVVSKFIAYSGENLKQDSLIVYYSIDGGEYQAAHMTATGNPDEYIGYITGYQGGSEIDYYVFGADESGHRYQQPVFGPLDPHHFTMEEHEPSGELVITPDTLWIEDPNPYSFTIKNETANAVTIQSADFEYGDHLYFEEGTPTFPITLQTGESTTIYVTYFYLLPPAKDGYNVDAVNLSTSIGDRKVTLMLNQSIYDYGLRPTSYDPLCITDETGAEGMVINMNLGSENPITILDITTENPEWIDILPEAELPTVLPVEEMFSFILKAKANVKGTVITTVTVHSDDGDAPFVVEINEDLLSVSEIKDEIGIYPNPTNGIFTIENENLSRITIYNLVGQAIYDASTSENKVNIDASDWNTGVYIVAVTNKSGDISVKKIMKR